MNLTEIFQESSYSIEGFNYCVAKVTDEYDMSDCFMVTKDRMETTVICEEKYLSTNYLEVKKEYCLIGIDVAIPFNAPGFIATVSGKMALKGIPVLVVSTYSRDYFVISVRDYVSAISALDELGIKKKL